MTSAPDPWTRRWLAVMALALAWAALRPHVLPAPAEAGREAVTVNIERVGGRFLADGAVPVRCVDRRP